MLRLSIVTALLAPLAGCPATEAEVGRGEARGMITDSVRSWAEGCGRTVTLTEADLCPHRHCTPTPVPAESLDRCLAGIADMGCTAAGLPTECVELVGAVSI